MDNLEEMDKLLEKHDLPRMNQEEIENINRPITSTEFETVIKILPTGLPSCSIVMTRSWNILMTRIMEHCDDTVMEHCDDKNSGAL